MPKIIQRDLIVTFQRNIVTVNPQTISGHPDLKDCVSRLNQKLGDYYFCYNLTGNKLYVILMLDPKKVSKIPSGLYVCQYEQVGASPLTTNSSGERIDLKFQIQQGVNAQIFIQIAEKTSGGNVTSWKREEFNLSWR